MSSTKSDQRQVVKNVSISKPGLEMIGIINKRGRMIDSLGFDSLNMPETKKEMFLMKIALQTSMQSDFDEELGKVNYYVTQHGERKFISIPIFDDDTLLIIAKNHCNHEILVNNITQKLKNSERLDENFLKGVVK